MSWVKRWIVRDETSTRQLAYGRTTDERFRGLRRAKRNEARLLLLALAPTLVYAPFATKWSEASGIERGLIVLLAAWFVGFASFGVFHMLRNGVRVVRNNHG